jgi:hypothetical protein
MTVYGATSRGTSRCADARSFLVVFWTISGIVPAIVPFKPSVFGIFAPSAAFDDVLRWLG